MTLIKTKKTRRLLENCPLFTFPVFKVIFAEKPHAFAELTNFPLLSENLLIAAPNNRPCMVFQFTAGLLQIGSYEAREGGEGSQSRVKKKTGESFDFS